MRVSAGISGQCMVSKRYNAFVHSDHIWYTEAKKVARPQHCKRKSHPARTSSKVSHRDAFSVHCVGSCCPRLSFMYCKMMLMPQANRLSSPWCMVRYVWDRIDELERSWWFRMCSQHWDKVWEIRDWVGQNPLETKHYLMTWEWVTQSTLTQVKQVASKIVSRLFKRNWSLVLTCLHSCLWVSSQGWNISNSNQSFKQKTKKENKTTSRQIQIWKRVRSSEPRVHIMVNRDSQTVHIKYGLIIQNKAHIYCDSGVRFHRICEGYFSDFRCFSLRRFCLAQKFI